MKVILEENLGITVEYFLRYLPFVSKIARLQDVSQINKALNEFNPDLLILNSKNINSAIKAYKDKHNVKIISYGQSDTADLCIVKDMSIVGDNVFYDKKKPILETKSFKENVEKTDVSVFIDNINESSLAHFLCMNYNVKLYGHANIKHPRYLGIPSLMDKYEIINKSKLVIDLGTYDFYNAILLDAYPLIYTGDKSNSYTSFDDMCSLMNSLEYALDISNEQELQQNLLKLQQQCYTNNDLTFVIDCLSKLNYSEQIEKLNNILEDITC